jgi:hypothetical protein
MTEKSPARKSRSSTPIIVNGSVIQNGTPSRGGLLHLSHRLDKDITPKTPVADASFRNDDKVSPMLAKLRMTPGLFIDTFTCNIRPTGCFFLKEKDNLLLVSELFYFCVCFFSL